MERIYVTVRARPLSLEESKTCPWRISANSVSIANQPTKFEFDRIFGQECRTANVYEARTKEIVASAVRGFNGTVFAYGQTNSGKTHTMRGSVAEPGIIPLSVHDLFKSIEEDMDREFLVRMSYMEIYNEEINDLLVPEHRKLQVHESLERGIYVAGLREEIVTSPEQVLDFMEFGESHRHIGETNMNLYSSRSHTIFRMIVESREKNEDGNMDNSCDAVRVSVLNLVDLAGSERAAKTGAEGMRLKEGSHINKSLMTLGTVIKKLSEGAESQGGHVPYRDSKLTRILQPALGGNSNTAIICNITLALVHTDETKSTLQFASRALRVTNCACVNEILTDAALLRRQRKEIEELRAKLQSSNSEHWEEEMLNLRNTLLQSALEKERIALELEEEKKAKAHRERRLLEQAKKIANLSSLVLCSERDEKGTYPSKNRRRVTWCPGRFPLKALNEVSSPAQATAIREPRRDDRDMELPPAFTELIQESEVAMDRIHNNACLPDIIENKDQQDDFFLPDARALLRVTNRRKMHLKRAEALQGYNESTEKWSGCEDQSLQYDVQKKFEEIEFGDSADMLGKSECTPNRTSTSSSTGPLSGSASCGHKSLTIRESEAILVIKQLQDKIKSLEMEKAFIQRNLDNVVELATEQNAYFREKYEELNQEVLSAPEEARMAHEDLCSGESDVTLKEDVKDLKVDSSIKLSMEIRGVALEVDDSRKVVDNVLSIVEDLFQNFSILSKMILDKSFFCPLQIVHHRLKEVRIALELESFASHDMVQLKAIIDEYKKIDCWMRKRTDQLELEKNLLTSHSVDHQKQIQDLKAELNCLEKAMAEQGLQHDLEKDGLLCQILTLQKEVSCLSSSSLARERESLRKELDKTKSKLKDTESKLKNVIQDKIKLESARAQSEREIKHLHGQRAILERDILKRDSLIDKRRESKSFDYNKAKGFVGVHEQTFQEDYKNLEIQAFEMEAEIVSLNEALTNAFGEKEEALATIGIIDSELEAMTSKLNTADSEAQLLKEELSSLSQRLEESESFSKKLELSLSLLSKEKEEMEMQLTDALLEMEAEKSIWSAKEKSVVSSNERLKISNEAKLKISDEEIVRLSEELLEVKHELEFCREQCRVLTERSALSEEIAEREKECSTSKSLEITHLRNELKEYIVGSVECENVKSKLEVLLSEYHQACDEVKKLQEQSSILTQEKDKLTSQVKEMDTGLDLANDCQLAKSRIDVEELARTSSMEVKMFDEALNNDKEKAELRMRLRSTQAKLDAFRGRYKEAMDEMGLMNKNFEEASTKLKKQLAYYGVEILRLKKELASKD